jgi:hypothetical protein
MKSECPQHHPIEWKTSQQRNNVPRGLTHFGETVKGARREYREFVRKGVAQGTRQDLEGGGMVRSAGGDISALPSMEKEEREPTDVRILGSGEFVRATLQGSETDFMKKYRPKRAMEELLAMAAKRSGLDPNLIRSRTRQKQYSRVRALFAWLAVVEEGYPAAAVARFLGISRVAVKKALERWAERGQVGLAIGK